MERDHQELVSPNQINDPHENVGCYQGCLKCCGNITGCFKTWVCCICCTSPYQIVKEGTVGVVQEFGKFSKLYGPGYYYINPCTEQITFVDKRERVLDIRRQVCMSKDNINVIIDAVVYFQVDNTYKSLFSIGDLVYGIRELCHTSLRDVFGMVTLQDALEDREKLAAHLKDAMEGPCYSWGVSVNRCLIQEILFTEDLQKSLSTAATAKRQAEGKIIGAQADVQAARLMRNAADILNTPAAMQVRYLEALASLGKVGNPKVMFFPSDYKQVGSNTKIDISKGNNMNAKK